MRIPAPTLIGSPQGIAASAGTIAQTGVTIPQGVTIIVAAAGGTAVSSVSDGSNTYTVDQAPGSGASNAGIASAFCATALSAATITVTFASAGTNRRLAVYTVPNMLRVGYVDTGAGTTGTSTSPSSGNFTTAFDEDLLFGCCGYGSGGGTYTAGGGWTKLDSVQVPSGPFLQTSYLLAPLAGTYAASGTITSANWVQAGQGYRGVRPRSPATFFNPGVV